MDAQTRTRSTRRERQPQSEAVPNGSRQIVTPMTRELYDTIWNDPKQVRELIEQRLPESPELFPEEMQDGFQLTGFLPESKKMPGIRLRQIRLKDRRRFSLRPSFVFSYMTGDVEELENPLLLLSIGTPCWVVTRIFGHNDMFWQRHLERLGRNSLVGVTVRDPSQLPDDLVADEHHCKWGSVKGFVAFVVGGGCTLGVALTKSADEQHLTEAYGVTKEECLDVKPDYAPRTVNTDGWWATQNAFQSLFPTVAIVLCFLHGFLKVRDRCRKEYELHKQIWEVYRAETAQEFRTRMAAFRVWFEEQTYSKVVGEMVGKLLKRVDEYAVSYSHPGCHRTSNMVDRLMNRLTRFLYAGRGIHGHQASSERRLRGWALLQNFRPYAPRSGSRREHQSPAHRLNDKQYDSHWLHNLQISGSLMGFRGAPRKR